MPVWDGNRGRQNCDGSRAQNADRLLIRPASGRQAGTGLSARTNHWKDTHTRGHSGIESRPKSTDTNLANAPDGTEHTLTVRECHLDGAARSPRGRPSFALLYVRPRAELEVSDHDAVGRLCFGQHLIEQTLGFEFGGAGESQFLDLGR